MILDLRLDIFGNMRIMTLMNKYFKNNKIVVAVSVFFAWFITVLLYPDNAKDGTNESSNELITFVILFASILGLVIVTRRVLSRNSTTVNKTKKAFINNPITGKLVTIFIMLALGFSVIVFALFVGMQFNQLSDAEAEKLGRIFIEDVVSGKKDLGDTVRAFNPKGYEVIELNGSPPGRNRTNARQMTYALTNIEPYTYIYVVVNVDNIFPWEDGRATLLRTEADHEDLSESARKKAEDLKLINESGCDSTYRKILADPNATDSDLKRAEIDRNLCIEFQTE